MSPRKTPKKKIGIEKLDRNAQENDGMDLDEELNVTLFSQDDDDSTISCQDFPRVCHVKRNLAMCHLSQEGIHIGGYENCKTTRAVSDQQSVEFEMEHPSIHCKQVSQRKQEVTRSNTFSSHIPDMTGNSFQDTKLSELDEEAGRGYGTGVMDAKVDLREHKMTFGCKSLHYVTTSALQYAPEKQTERLFHKNKYLSESVAGSSRFGTASGIESGHLVSQGIDKTSRTVSQGIDKTSRTVSQGIYEIGYQVGVSSNRIDTCKIKQHQTEENYAESRVGKSDLYQIKSSHFDAGLTGVRKNYQNQTGISFCIVSDVQKKDHFIKNNSSLNGGQMLKSDLNQMMENPSDKKDARKNELHHMKETTDVSETYKSYMGQIRGDHDKREEWKDGWSLSKFFKQGIDLNQTKGNMKGKRSSWKNEFLQIKEEPDTNKMGKSFLDQKTQNPDEKVVWKNSWSPSQICFYSKKKKDDYIKKVNKRSKTFCQGSDLNQMKENTYVKRNAWKDELCQIMGNCGESEAWKDSWSPSHKYLNSWKKKEDCYGFNKNKYDVKDLQTRQYEPGFIDTHCHLDFLFHRISHSGSYRKFQLDSLQTDPFPVSYEGCVAIFCKPWTFRKISWWEEMISEANVWAAFGCHPNFSQSFGEEEEVYLRHALQNSKTVAIGEIGLDYSRNDDNHEVQQSVFRRQLKIAVELKKPIVIHCREAHFDCIEILKEIVPRDYLIHRHCFTETWDKAKEWIETFSRLYLGFTNLITYPNCRRSWNIQEVARHIPLNRLLLETDTPYFRPHCYSDSGKYSHPGMAIHVAAQVALLRNEKVQTILKQARQNTKDMYGI